MTSRRRSVAVNWPWRDRAVRPPDPATSEPEGLRFGFDPASRCMSVRGELDLVNSSVLTDVMATLLERDPGAVTVNVHNLEFRDEVSMKLFLACCRSLNGAVAATSLIIVGAPPGARDACAVAGWGALLADD